jgi:hypothetical protein
MSIFPSIQEMLLAPELPQEQRIDREIPADVIERLSQIPDFVRAYEPDGMEPADFITYGVTQRTLSQFIESGWNGGDFRSKHHRHLPVSSGRSRPCCFSA